MKKFWRGLVTEDSAISILLASSPISVFLAFFFLSVISIRNQFLLELNWHFVAGNTMDPAYARAQNST